MNELVFIECVRIFRLGHQLENKKVMLNTRTWQHYHFHNLTIPLRDWI